MAQKYPGVGTPANSSAACLRVAAAAIAERGSAFFRELGPEEELAWLESSLALIWAAASGEDVAEECAEVLDELGEESQADQFDSSYPEFFAARSLELVGNAMATVLRPTPERVNASSVILREMLSILDFRLGGSKTVIIRYGDPAPPLGPLESREIQEEQSVLDAQSDTGEFDPESVGRIKEQAVRFAAEAIPYIRDCFDIDAT
ncbi:hypothetical protein ACIBVL_10540 [Streptomyces sp. NPDC049687]|uniref:hypothetical protein n=1 Tax=Streptomyces sp. NPDC049687 TaxID=3365596 RepID=UPI0037965AEC